MRLELLQSDEVVKLVRKFDMDELPLRLAAISRLWVVVRVIRVEGSLVDAMFLHNLHDAGNAWNGAVAMIEESQVTLEAEVSA